MAPLLVALLATAQPQGTPIRLEGTSLPLTQLTGASEVVGLCRRLVPAERVRHRGDAVEQGEAESRSERERDLSMSARYRIDVPAVRLAFAPYDGPEQWLKVTEPARLELDRGAVVLVAAEERGLPVRVTAAVARTILAAREAGRLDLQLVFDLPDDAVCAVDRRGKRHTLAVEPVEWSWREGDAVLAWGGVAGDRPGVNAALGAQPAVEIGEPVAGAAEARKAVAGRRADLIACYADELRRDPALDGVVVVDLGKRVTVAADSTGSATLTACVERVLGPLAGPAAASVPIRFELVPPRTEPAAPEATEGAEQP